MQDIMKRALFLLLATVVTVSAWAQERPESSKVLGKIQEVRGLVTVISGAQLINAVSGAPLVRGTRIASASSGGATFVYDNGCHISLKANESYLVEEDCDCGVMQAKVQEVGTRKPAARAKSPARTDPKILGKLLDVKGQVTVSDGLRSTAAMSEAPMILDNRIATGSNGGVTLAFDNGCHIRLKADEKYTVKENTNCCALAERVLPAASLLIPALILGGGGAIAIIVDGNDKNKTSGR